MTLPSPYVTINSTSQFPVGVNVTGGSTVTIALASSAGVYAWSVTCIGTDNHNTAAAINATLVVNPSTFTATFTAPTDAYGAALIFSSVVNNAIDIDGLFQSYLKTTFGVYVLTPSGLRLGGQNETTEGDINYGWLSKFNAAITTNGPFSAGGDLSGNAIVQTVIGIQTNPVQSGVLGPPEDGYVLTWNGSIWEPLPSTSGGILFGDVNGPTSATTVIKIQNNPVKAQSLGSSQDGYILTWVNADGEWEAEPAPVSFFAGGDLSGTNTNQTVIGIQAVAISATPPTTGQTLIATSPTAAHWATPAPGFTAGGDLSGTSTNQTVIGLQTTPVSSTPPTTGQILEYNGSVWIPTTGSFFTAGGDLSGTSTNQTVIGLDTTPIVITSLTSGNALLYNGTDWVNALIANANISASAAIAGTKISPNFGSQNVVTTGTLSSGAATVTSLQDTGLSTGVVHSDSSGNFTSSLVVNADVSATAAIAGTKISPNFGSQNILTTGTLGAGASTLGNTTTGTLGAGATVVTSLQDTAFSSAGVVHNDASGNFTSSTIVNADVSVTAAIAGTKISPNFGSQNVSTTGTLSAGATVVTSLQDTAFSSVGVVHNDASGNFTSSLIVNADVSSSAAIAVSKLAAGTSAQILQNNGTPVPTWTTVSGDVSITNAGVTTVLDIHGASVPAAGSLTQYNVLQVNSSSALTYGPVNLASNNAVTGVLDASHLPPLLGDVTGPVNANVVGNRKSYLFGGM